MPWHDISVVVRPDTPEWPGDTPFDCRWAWQIANGASVNVSCISGSPHVGTHADAPLHVRDGAAPSEALPVASFIGPAWVCDVRANDGALALADLLLPEGGVERLLLRTGRSIAAGSFPAFWPSLTTECLGALLARGLKLVGTDAPSVDDRESKTLANHHAIFAGGAMILENLDLRDVEAGAWELFAPPVRFAGLDAAPVRALLRSPRNS